MRSRHFNFAVGVAVSAAAHLLLWPAAMRIMVPRTVENPPHEKSGEVTLVLNDDPKPPPEVILPPVKPVPVIPPQDEMGEANAKGTGAQSAKGKDLLRAPEADQDQAFLSRDPVGMGRVGDPPAFFTGPRGEDGSGGQLGGSQAAPNPAHQPSPADRLASEKPTRESKPAIDPQKDRQPRESVVHLPEPQVPSLTAPKDVAPPPSKTASVGSAVADVNQPPLDEVKARGPLVQVASTSEGDLQLAPNEGPTTKPVHASSTAPPAQPDAPAERMSVAVAPQLSIPVAAVLAPPPPVVEVNLPKPMVKPLTPATPVSPVAVAAPALVTNGDGRAPGHDRPSADPAQESDSESDAFAKKLISAVMHDGRLEVRDGRKVTTTRPEILPGTWGEILSSPNPNPSVVLKVFIDEKGKVRHAEIFRSSGIIGVDLPCQRAMYDWTFGPSHDSQGRAVDDVFPFEIRFR